MWKKMQPNSTLIASNFVIHPQILIFSVFKIANLSPYWLHIKFSISLLFYCFTCLLLWWICGVRNLSQQTSLQCLRQGKILIKSLYLKGYTAKRLTYEFLEKSWTKHGVNKLFTSCGTQAQLTGGQPAADIPCSARTEENAKLLLQKFPQSATDLFCRLSGEVTENTFSPIKNT